MKIDDLYESYNDISSKIDRMFGAGTAKEMHGIKGAGVMFMKDRSGRNWKIIKMPDGNVRIEPDSMQEGDAIMFEGKTKALVGTVLSITEDTLIIEGEIHPFDESDMEQIDYSDLEPETDLSSMPHHDQIMAISREIYYLMHEALDHALGHPKLPDKADPDELFYLPPIDDEELELHHSENQRDIEHWDEEAEKLGYVAATDLAEYPFTDLHWYHIPTHRLFTIPEKDLKQNQQYRNVVNEDPVGEGIGKWVSAAALAGLLGLGANQLLDPSMAQKTPLGRAMAAAAANGDTYAARELKNLRNYIELNDGNKLAELNDTYLNVKEDASNDRRSFTVKITLNGGGKATRVFLAKNKEEALAKAKAWAKRERNATDVDTKVIAESDLGPKVDDEEDEDDISIYARVDQNDTLRDEVPLSKKKNPTTQFFRGPRGVVTNDQAMVAKRFLSNVVRDIETNDDIDIRVSTTPDADILKRNISLIKKGMKLSDLADLILGYEPDLRDYIEIEAREKLPRQLMDKLMWFWGGGDITGHVDPHLSDVLGEAEYHGREVKLGKPMAGDVKKYKVYVKDPKTGNIKKVNFGDKGMEIKRDNPARRRNFRKRHGCGTPRASDRTKAAYWSCRMWSNKPVSKILKGK